jgi:hypothetical protein
VEALCEAKSGGLPLATSTIRGAIARAPSDPEVLFTAALVYALAGDRPTTFGYLDKIFAVNYPRAAVLNAPELAQLRTDSRFQKWVYK